jgi:ATP-dependent helicase HepA
LSTNIDHQSLIDVKQKIDPTNFARFINSQRQVIDNLLQISRKSAEQTMTNIINAGTQAMLDTLGNELKRLVRLQEVNPNIKQIEIDQLNDGMHTAHACVQSAQLKLDAVRFIVTS